MANKLGCPIVALFPGARVGWRVPHPFAFFLAKGWETSNLIPPVHEESVNA
jgi:hypothetical protein